MIIKSKNFDLKLEEILKDELPTERYNEHEKFVLEIIRKWHSNMQFFTHQSSGSTGRPKKINISREKIEISARATMDFIDPKKRIKTSLLCLNPNHIGGAMVVYRSMVFDHDLTVVEPASDLSRAIENKSYDLASMVPMQFEKLTASQIDQFGTILIGGAPVGVKNIMSKAQIYSTFGMTETVSHIALRKIDDEVYTTTGDTQIATTDGNLLKIRGAITNHKWLTTNDIIEFISPNKFKWIGREDFIINSGGIKVNPEEIENLLHERIADEFIISSLPDSQLGRKVVLLSSGNERSFDFSELDKYHTPKEIYFNQKIFKTESGKIDRRKTQSNFEQNL